MPLQNHATLLRGMIHSSGMAHRCTPSSCDPFSRLASACSAFRIVTPASSLASKEWEPLSWPRLDLGSIFGAKHSQVALPQWSVTAPLVPITTRTGRQQQGRAPNQDKRRLGARPAAAAVAGPGDEGATLYWLVLVNERMRWLGWGRAMLMLA